MNFVNRLINNYKIANNELKKNNYPVSLHWQEYYNNEKKFLNPDNIYNFRNNFILSAGCDDSNIKKTKLDLLELLENFNNETLVKNLS